MATIVLSDEPIEIIPDPTAKYEINILNSKTTVTNLTYIMKLVLLSSNQNTISILENELKKDNAQINFFNSFQYTALNLACSNLHSSSFKVIELLLKCGADPNQVTPNSIIMNNIILANQTNTSDSNSPAIVELLLKNGAKIRYSTLSYIISTKNVCEKKFRTIQSLLKRGLIMNPKCDCINLYNCKKPISKTLNLDDPLRNTLISEFLKYEKDFEHLHDRDYFVNTSTDIIKMLTRKFIENNVKLKKVYLQHCDDIMLAQYIDKWYYQSEYIESIIDNLSHAAIQYYDSKKEIYDKNKKILKQIPQRRNEIYYEVNNIIGLCAKHSFNRKINKTEKNDKLLKLFGTSNYEKNIDFYL